MEQIVNNYQGRKMFLVLFKSIQYENQYSLVQQSLGLSITTCLMNMQTQQFFLNIKMSRLTR